MAKADVVSTPVGMDQRLASASIPLGEADPELLLRMGEGRPRGFWAREGRWFAHVGEVANIQIADPAGAPDRFQEVWAQARRLLSCSWKDPHSDVAPPSPRLFGGFSFREDHLALGPWEGFPSAHFVLPEIELMGGEERAVLTLRQLQSQEQDPGLSREGTISRLNEIKEALGVPLPKAAGKETWIPATRAETDQADWTEAVDRALDEVSAGGLEKVVMARVQTVSVDGALDPVEVVMNLWRENAGSHVFLYEPLPGKVLVGAAPETVATVSGGRFRATAVAGSIARGADEQEGLTLAQTLLRSPKDRREHQLCVEYMVARLGDLAERVQAQDEPHVLTLSAIQHLETAIEADLPPDQTVLSTLRALHPTPAVCGVPRDRALSFLKDTEPFHRGWYAGPVGWFDGDGNGVFVPALRSAVGGEREWRLFAGAGIVAGSDPAREWDETRIKFQPVLKALTRPRGPKGSPSEGQ